MADKVRDEVFWILGAARSGCAAGALLRRHGAVVVGIDDQQEADLGRRWEREGLTDLAPRAFDELLTGGLRPAEQPLPRAVIVSPGVPGGHDLLAGLPTGVEVMGELELASRFCRAELVAITGTNGKSTTTAWCAHVLGHEGRRVEAVGNLGRPLALVADELEAEDAAVVEVSSFQLETMRTFSPRAAAILNLAPDHLDRYATLQDYCAAKRIMAGLVPAGGSLVVWTGCPEAVAWPTVGRRVLYGDPSQDTTVYLDEGWLMARDDAGCARRILPTAHLSLKSPPNVLNAQAVAALGLSLGLDRERIAAGLRDFPGLAHRHQVVGRLGAVEFINDSKATNVHAVCAGLTGYPRPVVLIAGGSGKGEDFAPLAAAMGAVVTVLTIGDEGPRIAEALRDRVPVEEKDNLHDAVARAADIATARDAVVLLSPACASFDMFANYRDRGRAFAAAVADLGAEMIDPRP